MPYEPSDATSFTKKADTPKKQRQFSHIANSELASGASEATAIKAANGVIKRESLRPKRGIGRVGRSAGMRSSRRR